MTERPELDGLDALDGVTPDELLLASRTTDVTGLYGATGSVRESARLVRYNRIVMLTIPAVAPLRGDVRHRISMDAETAQADFASQADALRRDGWAVRSPEIWELPDPLRSDAEVPF